jgi:hypothetical protein
MFVPSPGSRARSKIKPFDNATMFMAGNLRTGKEFFLTGLTGLKDQKLENCAVIARTLSLAMGTWQSRKLLITTAAVSAS